MLHFNSSVQHVPGKDLTVPDTFSRSPLTEADSSSSHELANDVVAHENAVQASWLASSAKLQEFKQITEEDEELRAVDRFLSTGWLRHATAVPLNLLPYIKVEDDLSTCDGLITFQDRIVIPKSQRGEILQCLHASHQGLSSRREQAKSSVRWPRIIQDLKNAALNCVSGASNTAHLSNTNR